MNIIAGLRLIKPPVHQVFCVRDVKDCGEKLLQNKWMIYGINYFKRRVIKMNSQEREQLRKSILSNFIELIENKPGLKEDPDIKEAYEELKKQVGTKNEESEIPRSHEDEPGSNKEN